MRTIITLLHYVTAWASLMLKRKASNEGQITYLLNFWRLSLFTLIFSFSTSIQGQIFNLLNDSICLPERIVNNTYLHPLDQISLAVIHEELDEEIDKKGKSNLLVLEDLSVKAIQFSIKSGNEKALIETYLKMGFYYHEKNKINFSKLAYRRAIDHSRALNDTSLLVLSFLGYGWELIWGGDPEEIRTYTDSAYHLSNLSRDTALLIAISKKLPRLYYAIGDKYLAEERASEAAQLAIIKNDTAVVIFQSVFLADLYNELYLFERQLKILEQAKEFAAKSRDSTSQFQFYKFLASAYYSRNELDSALYYAKLNLPFAYSINRESHGLYHIASCYLELQMPDSARLYLDKVKVFHNEHNTYIEADFYLSLGKLELLSGNYKAALKYLKTIEWEAPKFEFSGKKAIYGALFDYYEKTNNHNLALAYLQKVNAINDSIFLIQSQSREGIKILDLEADAMKVKYEVLSKEKELQVALLSKEKQQKAFIYGVSIIILFIGAFAFHRFKKRKMMMAKQELIQERLRISRELHDEVGSTLSGIAMYTHLAKKQIENAQEDSAQQSLSIMQNSASEMVTKLGDIVWLINPQQDTISELLDRLEEYARQMATARSMNVQIDVQDGLSRFHIPMEARRNIYLFCKESINNAAKYSNGTMIRLQVIATSDKFRFSVSDDGIGFDEITVRRGNGLNNMRRRAEEIGATFHIESKPNQGSQIALQYKLTQ